MVTISSIRVKRGLAVILGGVFLYQVMVITNVLRQDADIIGGFERPHALNSNVESGRGLSGQKNSGNTAGNAIRLNPHVPEQLPDLATGYIFSAERMLHKKQEAIQPADNISIEDVFYAGSIITGKEKIALVSYQEPAVNNRRSGIVRRGQTQQAAGRKLKRLQMHDSIGGYTVADIFPDRLLLMKHGEEKEKFLHDPDKPVVRLSKPAAGNAPGRTAADRFRTRLKNQPVQPPVRQ